LPTRDFGTSVAIAGELVLVGAPARRPDVGEACLFAKQGSAWVESESFVSPEGHSWFGAAVSLSHENVAIGSPTDPADLAPIWTSRAFVTRVPEIPPEVSGAGSGVPLLIRKTGAVLQLSFE